MTAKRPLSSQLRLQSSPGAGCYHPDAGLPCRELDDALGLTDSSAEYLKEGRTGKNILHKLTLCWTMQSGRLAGYDDTNDADRLSQDPAMRVVVGWKGPDRKAASTSEMSTVRDRLTQKDNRKGCSCLACQERRIILDIDSSRSTWSGHSSARVLRPGNVHRDAPRQWD